MNTDNETLQDLARALDQAISSNSPAVRKQFEQLMVLLALTQTTGDNQLPGPFEQMMQNVESLIRRCEQVEQRLLQVELNKNTYQNPYTLRPDSSDSYGPVLNTLQPFTYTTGNTSGHAAGTITLTGGTYDTISLGDYNYSDNTMLTGAAGSDLLISQDIDKLIEQMSITINKEKKNA